MIETFTKAIVREIGRNYGKAASNMLLGDAHSTPYRRVGNYSNRKKVLGSTSGGYKYENHLDRLITTFQIKGELATFNSAQNIYNEYFKLVEEANVDNNIDPSEAIYLIEQYYRTVEILRKISIALKEMGAEKKSQVVVEKVSNLIEFIKSLDKNYKEIKGRELNVDKSFKKYSIISGVVFLISLLTVVLTAISTKDNLNKTLIAGLWIIPIVSFVFMLYFNSKYGKQKKEVENHNLNLDISNRIKTQINKAANFISVQQLEY